MADLREQKRLLVEFRDKRQTGIIGLILVIKACLTTLIHNYLRENHLIKNLLLNHLLFPGRFC